MVHSRQFNCAEDKEVKICRKAVCMPGVFGHRLHRFTQKIPATNSTNCTIKYFYLFVFFAVTCPAYRSGRLTAVRFVANPLCNTCILCGRLLFRNLSNSFIHQLIKFLRFFYHGVVANTFNVVNNQTRFAVFFYRFFIHGFQIA